mmetsp:Transcript_4663/g.11314  ORF Transcript_4663/g.11314 Transcript_4663/m.11314 type:complete len:494 (-) Transcript_4663:156-1637(-)
MAPKAKPEAKAKPAAKADAKAKPKPKKDDKEPEDDKPKVEKPDKEAHEAEINAKTEEIDKLQKKLSEISKQIGGLSTGKEEFQAKRAEITVVLQEIRSRFDSLVAAKKEIQERSGAQAQEDRKKRDELRKTRSSVGYTTEKDIDDRMNAIDIKMHTSSLSLKEEKELMKELAQLKKDRPKVANMLQMESALNEVSLDAGKSVKEQLDDLNKQIDEVKKEREAQSAKLTELLNSRSEQMKGFEPLQEEREKINAKIKEKLGEKSKIRDDFRSKEREYYAYVQEQKHARQEKIRAERAQREKEWQEERKKRDREKRNEEPYVAERTLLEQTISFCKGLLPKEEEKAAEKEEHDGTKYEAEGLTLLSKKEDRDEFYFAPTKKKAQNKKKGGSKKEDSSSGAQPIKHNIETFTLFDKLKIDPPMTTDDLPATLEMLDKELDNYKEKVKKWEEDLIELRRREDLGLEVEEEKPAEEEKKDEGEEKQETKEEAAEEEGS